MANVINKTTLQYLKSVHTPDYMDGNWLINPDLSAVDGVAPKYWKIVNDQVVEMDSLEKEVVDLNDLPTIKQRKLADIDARSNEIIDEGITFDGHLFSLSANAQLNWNSIFTAMQGGLIPADADFEVSTKEPENDKYLLTPDKRNAFFGLILSTVSTILAGGRALKQQVKNATNKEQVEAVIDDR